METRAAATTEQGRAEAAPAHSSLSLLLPKGRERRALPEQHRSAPAGATSAARLCQQTAGAAARRLALPPHRSSAAPARGKSHNIELARGGGASAPLPAAHSAQSPAAPAAAILREAAAVCHYLPAPPHGPPSPPRRPGRAAPDGSCSLAPHGSEPGLRCSAGKVVSGARWRSTACWEM